VASHIPCVKNPVRGLDHGVFIPLKLIFPEASIPVVCLSLQNDLDPERHLAAGLALSPLREENVLIIGSGMSYHNMSGFRVQSGKLAIPESEAFDDWLKASCEQKDELRQQQLLAWEAAPFARACHPREEHLLPMMVAAGAASGNSGKRVFSDVVMGAQVAGFRFG
jgi:aromatic ring-opening dioxygenase catalytic subunit (LigB family)